MNSGLHKLSELKLPTYKTNAMRQRTYSLAYLSSHRCTPAEAVRVAAQTGYSFVGLRLWPNAPGAPQQHLLDQQIGRAHV